MMLYTFQLRIKFGVTSTEVTGLLEHLVVFLFTEKTRVI